MNTVFLIYCVKAHLEEGVYLMHKIFTWFTVVISLQRIKRENWIKRETSTFQTRKSTLLTVMKWTDFHVQYFGISGGLSSHYWQINFLSLSTQSTYKALKPLECKTVVVLKIISMPL